MTAAAKYRSTACLVGSSALLLGGVSVQPTATGANDAAESAFAARRPNIVVIMVDDMRLSDLAGMPHVQQLMGDAGTTFERTYAQFPLCTPSRATFLSGRYAHNHKVLGNAAPLGGATRFRDKQTLPVWLHRAGYRTMMLGKYMNDYKPRYVPPGWTGWAALNKQVTHYWSYRFNINGERNLWRRNLYQTDTLTDMARHRIRLGARSGKPFFLWTSYVSPHNGAPQESDDPVGPTPVAAARHHFAYDGRQPDLPPNFNEEDLSDKPSYLKDRRPVNVAAMVEFWRQRQEALMSVDESVAELITELRSQNVLANTVVAFISDNGHFQGEHRLKAKGQPYEESVRVPMIIRGPGFDAGVTVSQQATLADLAPTFLRAAGARGPGRLDGAPLQRLVANPDALANRPILLEFAREKVPQSPRDRLGRWYVAVRSASDELYVKYASGEREYYDLRVDPYQLRNTVDAESSRDAVARLNRLLIKLRNCEGAQCRHPVVAGSP